MLAIASLPRSEGSSNHEQRAVCRDGPVWARESCSFTEIYVAGIKLQRRLSMATAHRTLAGGAHLAVAAVHGLVMEDAARGDGCAIHSSLAVSQQAGGRRAWQSIGEASESSGRRRWQTGGRGRAEACRLPRIDFPLISISAYAWPMCNRSPCCNRYIFQIVRRYQTVAESSVQGPAGSCRHRPLVRDNLCVVSNATG